MRTDVRAALGLIRSLAIYHGRPWRKRRLHRFYQPLIGPGDLCFDIGAHVGNRAGAMLGCGASVVALEPQPLFLSFLRRFVRSDRLTILGKAVGAAPGELTLYISSRHPTVATLSPDWLKIVGASEGFEKVAWDRSARVEVTTLDALIATYGPPRFCKIDVEGMEMDILNGLSRPIPLIAFEYLPAALDLAFGCLERLDGLGRYSYNLVAGEDHFFASPEWLSSTALREIVPGLAGDGRSGDIYARLAV